MTDPILYLSILLGLGGIYVLISCFHDNDYGDDGEKYIYNLEHTLKRWLMGFKPLLLKESYLKKRTIKKLLRITEMLFLFSKFNFQLYSFLSLSVGPLSVYICALNRTILLVGWWACLVRTK